MKKSSLSAQNVKSTACYIVSLTIPNPRSTTADNVRY